MRLRINLDIALESLLRTDNGANPNNPALFLLLAHNQGIVGCGRIAIVISVLVILVGILLSLYFLNIRQHIPSEEELPNEELIRNTEMLEEVKIFLAKYPDALIEIDQSGRLAVDYRVSKPSKEESMEVEPYLRLRVLLNPDGEPVEMFVKCSVGQSKIIERKNIVSYLKTETCLE